MERSYSWMKDPLVGLIDYKLVALSTAKSEIYTTIDGIKIAHLKVLLNELDDRDMSLETTYQRRPSIYSDGSQLRDYVTRLSYFRQLVVNGGTKYIPKTRYLISWRSPFSQKHSSNCLKPWSATFPIYILKYQSKETKQSGEHKATATCCRYSCGGELETILTSIVMYSEKTARYAYTTWVGNWHYAFGAVFFQNGSIYERECPWRLIGTRGPVNQTWSGGCPS